MRIDILTVVPSLLDSPLSDSIVQRARDKGVVDIRVHNIRDWSKDKHNKVDDEPFGGIAGMVMTIQPILDAIEALQSECTYSQIIYLTPDGEPLKHPRQSALDFRQLAHHLWPLQRHRPTVARPRCDSGIVHR